MELFITIGKVERAEIQYEPNGRSRGTGVVQFDTAENADTAIGKYLTGKHTFSIADKCAIAKFSGYQYGGRPLGLSFVRYSSGSGDAMEGAEPTGISQDQIM